MIPTVDDLKQGRAALEAREWATAFELFNDARATTTLTAEDLDALAEASWWLGRLGDCIQARAAAFDGFIAADDPERATACGDQVIEGARSRGATSDDHRVGVAG
jgi:hypothetical protein